MLTLGALVGRVELELAFAGGVAATPHEAVRVAGLATLTLPQLLGGEPQRRLEPGSLVLLTEMPFRLRGRAEVALETLLEQLALDGCAGLAVSVLSGAHQPFSLAVREVSAALGVPLLTTTAPPRQWVRAGRDLTERRLAEAEARAGQLTTLVQQLPTRAADPEAMQRIADWLARALRAQVLVSEPGSVLAASPETAAEALAEAFLRGHREGLAHDRSQGPHTRLIPLSPPGDAQPPAPADDAWGGRGATAGDLAAVGAVSAADAGNTVLAVARRSPPFDDADLRLMRHAARLLGLLDQARREHRAAADAAHAARMAAVELLLDAEVDKARRVMATQAPGLLTPDAVRVFVVETPQDRRDAVLLRCEAGTAGRALVVADPREDRRILVVEPIRPRRTGDAVATALTRLVAELGADASLGGSGTYPMVMLADALQEAITAQRFALRRPDAVALSAQSTDLVSVLPRDAARRWARGLLDPLLGPDAQGEQMRDTLPTALAFPYAVAARRLRVHRNTVRRRVAKAAELLDMDFATVRDRATVGLALDLLADRHRPERSLTLVGGATPTLESLLASPEARAWADNLLCGARGDRRNLLATAAVWLAHDAHVEPTARALGLSEFTVRSHLRALEGHMARDLGSLGGLRDLQFSLHILNGAVGSTDLRGDLCSTP
ncbi:helix-turn-helix domain-containing protein [Streptomyces sp. MNP-20]|uniref:helix-turn-helix domain-containing protein n=1 Tax=Streptomyces sp. MNP-20 TaxID=2721165 RepID=UPI001554999E|nr:helix-turn-helix domain-containing protein [Streptomyces sp. MNP-20]